MPLEITDVTSIKNDKGEEQVRRDGQGRYVVKPASVNFSELVDLRDALTMMIQLDTSKPGGESEGAG